MTARPAPVFGLLCSLACTHLADLDDDGWSVWRRLRLRWWVRDGAEGVMRIPLGVWGAFHSRPGCADLMRESSSADVRNLAARLDAKAAAEAFDNLLANACKP